MPDLPSTHDATKPLAQMNLLDRLAGAIRPLVATQPVHVIALLGLCAAYIQGGLVKLLDFNAAVAETQSFGLPFAAAATVATIVTELAGSALTVVTGLVDAVSYLKLGHVFVANMTGNVVFLGFAAAGASEHSVAPSLIAIGAFLVGAIAGGRLGSSTGGHRGRFLALSTYAEV